MKPGSLFPTLLLLVVLSALAACSPRPGLVGDWRAETEGENLISLQEDGTARISVDMNVGLLGPVRGESHGTWQIVEKNRLLLEMDTRGVKTSEISRFVLQNGDLILTSEKNGQSMRYRRPMESADLMVGKSTLSPEQQIENHLRQIYAAASQYRLENGAQAVAYETLEVVCFSPLTPVAGERYGGLLIHEGQPLTVTTAAGRKITYDPR